MNRSVTHNTKKDIHFKSGTFIKAGEACVIQMVAGSNTIAHITAYNNLSQKIGFKIKATQLHYWFSEFEQVTEEDIEKALMDGACYSIYALGEGELEPDGSDSYGFPSKVLAAGFM